MPPKDHPIWGVAKHIVVAATLVAFAALWTKNGWDWRADLPTIVAALASLLGVQIAQSATKTE